MHKSHIMVYFINTHFNCNPFTEFNTFLATSCLYLSDAPPHFCAPVDPMICPTVFELIAVPIAHLSSFFPRTRSTGVEFLSTMSTLGHSEALPNHFCSVLGPVLVCSSIRM
jgi:hypothetical protein